MIKNILKIIDYLFCHYIGIKNQKLVPCRLKINRNTLSIESRESFKRHSYTNNLYAFCTSSLNELDDKNKRKLGTAIGKSIAKNLIISFEPLTIEKKNGT